MTTVVVILFPFLQRGKRVEFPLRLAVVGEGPGNAQAQMKLTYLPTEVFAFWLNLLKVGLPALSVIVVFSSLRNGPTHLL